MIDDNDAAIARAESSQQYTIRGRSQRMADLKVLYDERDRLAALSGQPTTMATVGVRTRPS